MNKELRIQARLAWNNWPDNESSRREIAAHEARDPVSAGAWDRVVSAIMKSAPSMDTSQNNAETLPQREPAGGGADTRRDQCLQEIVTISEEMGLYENPAD